MTEVDGYVTGLKPAVADKNIETVAAVVNEVEKADSGKPKRKRSASKFVAYARTGECELKEFAFGNTIESVAQKVLESENDGEFVICCIRRKVRLARKTKTVLEDVK